MIGRVGSWACLLALATSACLFDDAKTKGLPCLEDRHCGGGQTCVQGVCGGPQREYGGDPCALAANVCLDALTLGTCEGDTTVSTSCEEFCVGQGYAAAIGCARSSDSLAACYCDEGRRSCTPEGGTTDDGEVGGGETTESGGALLPLPMCMGEEYVESTCVDGYTELTDCDELCGRTERRAEGCDPSQASTGGSACVCSEGSCSSGTTYCADALTEMYCSSGAWKARPCTDHLCADGDTDGGVGSESLGCGYDEQLFQFGCRCTR